MSADNWGECPKCKQTAQKDQEQRVHKVANSYGKIDMALWMEQNRAANEPLNTETNLREDYEIGIDPEGEFYVSYKGSCDKCGFKHSFTRKEQLI